jgi:hypothetical protein
MAHGAGHKAYGKISLFYSTLSLEPCTLSLSYGQSFAGEKNEPLETFASFQ